VINFPLIRLNESFSFLPVNINEKVFPSSLVHLFEKFQKKVLTGIWPSPQPLVYRTVVHGPHGSGASKMPILPL
jgi:hypothetical protein